MAPNLLSKPAAFLSFLLTLSVIDTVVALNPSDAFFIEGGVISGVVGSIIFPFGLICGIPAFGVGIVVKNFEEGWIEDDDGPEPFPTCGAVIAGLPETTSDRAVPTGPYEPTPAGPTTTLCLEPIETLLPCPGEPLYSKHRGKSQAAETSNQVLMAYKSDKLRGRDVQRLRDTTLHIYAADDAVLEGSDFEVRGNVSWEKSHKHAGLIQGEHKFDVPDIDEPVEGIILVLHEQAADEASKDAFNLVVEAANRGYRQTDLVETIKGLETMLLQMPDSEVAPE